MEKEEAFKEEGKIQNCHTLARKTQKGFQKLILIISELVITKINLNPINCNLSATNY